MVDKIRQIIPRIANRMDIQSGISQQSDEIKTALQIKIFG